MFLRNLIDSSISEYPAPFTSEQNKMASSYVYVTEEELFFNKRSRRARHYQKKQRNFSIKYSKICISFIFLAINALRMCFKMFRLQMMSGRQPTFRKLVRI